MTNAVAAVDLGATSGRVMLGHIGQGELRLEAVARFSNNPVRTIDGLHWNILELYRNVLIGLGAASRHETVASIAVDSWACDYALLRGGRMLSTPYHYRDERTAAGIARTHAIVRPEELYAANGLQFLPFNSLYQLATDDVKLAESMLLVPDLINYWLTGRMAAERTNASTTGLLNPHTREWDDTLIARLGLPRGIFPELISAGTAVGGLLPSVASELKMSAGTQVTAVGSHDTASAVVAVPATSEYFAYISCGTWGLVGVEVEHPVITDAGRAANFTNEGGVDGRVRYLHNVMGLWVLSESLRTWERDGVPIELPSLLSQAAAIDTPMPVFDANDGRLFPPGDMPSRIAEILGELGRPVPQSPAEFVRCILESLAEAFADAVHGASELAGTRVDVIHIVGGGALNTLLCQLTADRAGRPVLAGPVEATAIGNVLVQGRAAGLIDGDLEALRGLVARWFEPVRYEPRTSAR
jgi:rhamnulokinase